MPERRYVTTSGTSVKNLKQSIGMLLIDWGRGLMARGLDAAEGNRNRGNLPWDRRVSQDEDRYVTFYDRETVVQKIADSLRNVPIVKGLCDRMADFVCGPMGLQTQSVTSSDAWNRESEDWLKEWESACEVTGRIPWRKVQRAHVLARLYAGELFTVFRPTGQLQIIEAERVRPPADKADKPSKTEYDGMRLSGPTVAAWYIADRNDDGTFYKAPGRWIDAANVYHFGSPWRIDSIRPLPELAAGCNVMQDVQEISLFTLIQMKKQARIAGAMNSEGATDMMATRGSAGKGKTANGVAVQKVDEIGVFVRGQPGESLTLASPATPNPNLEGHLVFTLRQFCACVGIPYEVAMMDATRGNLSQNKAVRELFARVVEAWQADLADYVRYVRAFALGHAIRTRQIAPAPVVNGRSEWDRCDIQPPPATWADPQDAIDADAKELRYGNTTHGAVIKRRGGDLETLWRARAKEEQLRQAIAKEYGVDPDKIASIEIPGASNAPAAVAPAAVAPEQETQDDE